MAAKEKLTVNVSTKDIIRQRATEDGLDQGAYLDRLVRQDDLRRRIREDRLTMQRAGLLSGDRAARNDQLAAEIVRRRRAAGE
ncbi:MAG: hypothetical protein ACRDTM_16375 [Micromonosporaceae bacterium]